jgi:hypothetical protein
VVNDDLLGSMELACAVSGAKLVLVLGHTSCGAVKGAIDDVVLGNLTGLLARIKPAIPETKFEGEQSSKDPAYVDAVARTNVAVALENIRRRSPLLTEWKRRDQSRSPVRCTTSRTARWTSSVSGLSTRNEPQIGFSREATGFCKDLFIKIWVQLPGKYSET